MFKELRQLWKELDIIQKVFVVVLLPFTLVIGVVYGLWLIFWNKYGLAFICAAALLQSTDTPEEGWERGQAAAMLVGFILLIIKAIRDRNK